MFPNVLEVARQWIRERVRPGETVVDATVGNGHDTLFLAEWVGPAGRVIGYDIQAEALSSAHARLAEHGVQERVRLIQASHEEMKQLTEPIAAVMFNLGYLPGGDKAITTQAASTVRAIEAGLSCLRPGGIMTVVVYWGHPVGQVEKDAVMAYCEQLDQRAFLVLAYRYLNQRNQAPFLLGIEKRTV